MDANEIIRIISESKKRTPVRALFKGAVEEVDFSDFAEFYEGVDFVEVYDELNVVREFAEKNSDVEMTRLEIDRRNSAVPLADLSKYNARIEPGAIIRDMVEIGDRAVIMMGAVLNIGAIIGEGTMIDMNVVVGGRAIVGKNCHIGAGTVLAGVVEPPSATPVVVEDNVLMGANAVVLEGVRIGTGSVVAAGAVVTADVPPLTVVAGVPARIIKKVDDKTRSKTELVEALRNL
ncbi:MAG TPA: 2,3,4,5-tetrahydropyridine-2,6-dicarboxylate N-acetyltransferase [bacterium]|nr:2,3,4,5-tetrahydropyridine-2,6-dicarboxylate N-acetyltransferase [bacterium]